MHPWNPYRNTQTSLLSHRRIHLSKRHMTTFSELASLALYTTPLPGGLRSPLRMRNLKGLLISLSRRWGKRDLYQSRRLTEAIMRGDFRVVLSIPEGRPCPPVSAFLIELCAFLEVGADSVEFIGAKQDELCSVDSGYCVRSSRSAEWQTWLKSEEDTRSGHRNGFNSYLPLLACKLNSNWEMVGTELDDFSDETALKNVESNNLQLSIQILKASNDRPILFAQGEQTFDFCMCNPPFYASKEEIEQSAEGKELPPNAVSHFPFLFRFALYSLPGRFCFLNLTSWYAQAQTFEMIYLPGGEETFVGRTVKESEQFGVQCKWYASVIKLFKLASGPSKDGHRVSM
ncbi:hypothetical protein CVT26_014407 [Gymnopilus dilepis]|uniref:Uncharacterized protein n=1 Tax=Gymnopilus dilepis TaxID=231916 RepID=A0A409WTI8_9AGAR|nr:hypothetical protein CVT26_014407 [Gymnopilus dilepis]